MHSQTITEKVDYAGVRAVVIGGGTGSFMLLSALRAYVGTLSAIVAMSDSGGSTGVLRDELGVLPPGDVRQCLVALSDTPKYMRELFNYRFEEGSLKGHAFGNLFLSALEKVASGFAEGVKLAEQMLNVKGHVLPVTTSSVRLVAEFPNGKKIENEHEIQRYDFNGQRPVLRLEPAAVINPEAARAISEADIITVGPGDLCSSIIPVLLPGGMSQALRETKAIKVFISNLVNKPLSTKDMRVQDYITEIERHLGFQPFDFVIYNTAEPTKAQAERYLREGELPVKFSPKYSAAQQYEAVGVPLVAGEEEQGAADSLHARNLIRHDGDQLARTLMRIYFSR